MSTELKVEEKICKRCGESKPVAKFPKQRNGKPTNPCYKCRTNSCKPRTAEQKARLVINARKYYYQKKNSDPNFLLRRRAANKKCVAKKGAEAVRKRNREYFKKYSSELHDRYIKNVLTKQSKSNKRLRIDIPPQLLELKRQQIILKRVIDETTKQHTS